MNRLFILLVLLFGAIECNRPLSWQENQYWKANCGRKPYHQNNFVDNKRHIAGGQEQPGYLAPWAIRISFNGGSCSGTLISPRHILSASHCVMMSRNTAPPQIKFSHQACNGSDLILTQDNNEFTVFNSYGALLSNKVSKIVLVNFCYQPVVDYDDFMIMELKEDIALNDYVYPACITNNMSFQQPGLTIRVTAFGHDNWDDENKNGQGTLKLRTGTFQIKGSWRDDRGFLIYNKATQIRGGDSGGTVLHYVNGQYYVIGVVDVSTWQGAAGIGSAITHHSQICYHTGRCN